MDSLYQSGYVVGWEPFGYVYTYVMLARAELVWVGLSYLLYWGSLPRRSARWRECRARTGIAVLWALLMHTGMCCLYTAIVVDFSGLHRSVHLSPMALVVDLQPLALELISSTETRQWWTSTVLVLVALLVAAWAAWALQVLCWCWHIAKLNTAHANESVQEAEEGPSYRREEGAQAEAAIGSTISYW